MEKLLSTCCIVTWLTKTSRNHDHTAPIYLFMSSLQLSPYIQRTSCRCPAQFCARLSAARSSTACVYKNNRFSAYIIEWSIWSYSGSGVCLLSALSYCCSISIMQCWLALVACCGPRGGLKHCYRILWPCRLVSDNTHSGNIFYMIY